MRRTVCTVVTTATQEMVGCLLSAVGGPNPNALDGLGKAYFDGLVFFGNDDIGAAERGLAILGVGLDDAGREQSLKGLTTQLWGVRDAVALPPMHEVVRTDEAAPSTEVNLGSAKLTGDLPVDVLGGRGGHLEARGAPQVRVAVLGDGLEEVEGSPSGARQRPGQTGVAEGRDPCLLSEGMNRSEPGGDVEVTAEHDGNIEGIANCERDEVGHQGRVDHLLFGVGDDLVAVRALACASAAVEPMDEEARPSLQLVEEVGQRVPGPIIVGRGRNAGVVVRGSESGPANPLNHPLGELTVVEPSVLRVPTKGLHMVLSIEKQSDTHRANPGVHEEDSSSRQGDVTPKLAFVLALTS